MAKLGVQCPCVCSGWCGASIIEEHLRGLSDL